MTLCTCQSLPSDWHSLIPRSREMEGRIDGTYLVAIVLAHEVATEVGVLVAVQAAGEEGLAASLALGHAGIADVGDGCGSNKSNEKEERKHLEEFSHDHRDDRSSVDEKQVSDDVVLWV